MSHHIDITGSQITATVSGALDGEAARSLCSAVRAAGFQGAAVVLEMQDIASVDVEGVTQLVALKRWAEREGGKLVIAAPSYEVTDALRQNGLDRIFEIAPTRTAAAGSGHSPYEAPPLPFEAPPSFAPQPDDGPPSFAPPVPPPPPPAGIYDEPPSFAEPPSRYEAPPAYQPPPAPEPAWNPPPPPRAAEPEPPRRRVEEPEENVWSHPAPDAARVERAAPAVAASPLASMPTGPKKKGKGGLIAALILLLLAGSGAAAWFFIFKKPEVLAATEVWERMEGADSGFEIKFKNAEMLQLKDSTLPADLDFDPEVRDAGNGVKMQIIAGNTREIGPHEFTVVARDKNGKESPPVKFSFTITAEEVRDMSGGKLPQAKAGVALPAGLELARGCVTADAPELKDSGLSVKLDAKARKAWLSGTPVKDGELKFTLKSTNADGKEKSLSYTLTVQPADPPKPEVQPKPEENPKPVENPRPEENPKPVENPRPEENPKPVENPKPEENPKPVENPKPEENPKPAETPKAKPEAPSLDEQTLTMLRDRIDRSRFAQADKSRMLAAVNQVQSAKKIATIQFGNGERSIGKDERERLTGILRNTPELADSEGRKIMDFVVVGYASNRGGAALNIAISKARAASVESVLREVAGIRPTFTGDYGATNVLGDDEAANRVVEIHAVIVRQEARSALDQLVEYMREVSGSKR